MRIIDRYLLRQFAWVFLICFVSLNGLYVVFDAFTNLDEFIRFANHRGSLLGVMAEYYAYRSVFFFDRISGVLAMISAMFTLTWIQRFNELVALMAAGISRLRVVAPVVAAAFVISLGAAANRELVIPHLRDELSRNPKDLVGDLPQEVRPRYDHLTDIFMSGKEIYRIDQRIEHPSFLLPAGLDRHGKLLVAEKAFFQAADEHHPAGYLFRGVTQPAGLAGLASLDRGGKRVIYSPHDSGNWLKPNECFVASEITLEQLSGTSGSREFSSTWELIRGLANPSLDYGADVRVAVHARIVQPFLDLTLLFLGLPLVVARENRKFFLSIGICVIVVVLFMLVVLACQYLGKILLIEPALSVFLPLMIFVPLAAALFDRLQR